MCDKNCGNNCNSCEPVYCLMEPSDLTSLFYKVGDNKAALDRVLGVVQKLVSIYRAAKKEVANFNEDLLELDRFVDQTQNGLMNGHEFKEKYLESVAQLLNLINTCNGASNSQLLTLIPGITLAVDAEGNNLRFLASGQQFIPTEIQMGHDDHDEEENLMSIDHITYDFTNAYADSQANQNGNVFAHVSAPILDAAGDETETGNYNGALANNSHDVTMSLARQVIDSHQDWAKDGNNFANKVYRLIGFFDRMERRMISLNNFLVSSYCN